MSIALITEAPPRLRQLGHLPGPKGWPVLGNLPQIKPAEMHLLLDRWAQEYGRYFQIRMGDRRVLVVADHEAVAGVLRDRPEGFAAPSGWRRSAWRWASSRACSA